MTEDSNQPTAVSNQQSAARLVDRAPDIRRHDAERLLAAASGSSRAALAAGVEVSDEVAARFLAFVDRRRGGEPLQYIEGTVQFGPVELAVDPRALIPRPETELMWQMACEALGEAGPGHIIVDVGTGCGNLALALKYWNPRAQVYGTDLSESALALAKENAARTGLDVRFLHGDLFEPLPVSLRGRIDLLVANPPYVTGGEFADLPAEVRDWEPEGSLVAGPGGTGFIERIGRDAHWWLAVGGWAFCEIGEAQGPAALAAFRGVHREVRHDLAGRDRFLAARKGAPCSV